MEQLTEAQVKDMIEQALNARERQNAFGVSLIAAHTHNNSDSALINRIANKLPSVTYSASAAAVTPLAIGDIFVNTTTKKVYIATGRASSSDWTLLN